ncbi:MAG TPA: class I SAM-dependent methyltransferase, partial [Firmicutes bacterium]|nr:class I SAM-dependent methyltransferase [Bacillota bacterium]
MAVDGYYLNHRQEMLEFVPDSAKRIIDIGCAAGEFIRNLGNIYGREVWGVEPDKRAAKSAMKYAYKILNMDADRALQKLPNRYFD